MKHPFALKNYETGKIERIRWLTGDAAALRNTILAEKGIQKQWQWHPTHRMPAATIR